MAYEDRRPVCFLLERGSPQRFVLPANCFSTSCGDGNGDRWAQANRNSYRLHPTCLIDRASLAGQRNRGHRYVDSRFDGEDVGRACAVEIPPG